MAERPNHFKRPCIPIPDGFYVNKKDLRVYIKTISEEASNGNGTAEGKDEQLSRVVVGRVTSIEDNTFFPNLTFGQYFPTLWEKHYGYNPTIPPIVITGIYAAIIGILEHTGLYDLLLNQSQFTPLLQKEMLPTNLRHTHKKITFYLATLLIKMDGCLIFFLIKYRQIQ